MKRGLRLFIGALVMCAAAGAWADSSTEADYGEIDLVLDGWDGSTVSITDNGVNYRTTAAGPYNYTLSNWDDHKDGTDTFDLPDEDFEEKGFCIDLDHTINQNRQYENGTIQDVEVGLGAIGDKIEKLYKMYLAETATQITGNALSFAIWEVTRDTTYNLASGLFRVFDPNDNGNVDKGITKANAWLALLAGETVDKPLEQSEVYAIVGLTDPQNPNKTIQVQSLLFSNKLEVPAPTGLASLAGLAVMLSWVGGRRRRGLR